MRIMFFNNKYKYVTGGMGQQIPNPGNQMNPMGNQMQMNAMGVQGQQMGQMNNMVQMNMNAGMQQNPMNVSTDTFILIQRILILKINLKL